MDLLTLWKTDLNYAEDSAGGPDVTVGILAKMDKVTLLQVFSSFFIYTSSLNSAYYWANCHILLVFCSPEKKAQYSSFSFLVIIVMNYFILFFFLLDGCKVTIGHIWKCDATSNWRMQGSCTVHSRSNFKFSFLCLFYFSEKK